MSPIPTTDPIPLPAPVALFKFLHDLTLTLHFVSVHLLLGGLMIALFLNWRGHASGNRSWALASDSMIGWLPIVMTYVINLGVPPLLFTQVLYGPALYTSSILIGAIWISVIALLIATYHLLYKATARAERHEPWAAVGLLSLLGALAISRIYNLNMTLMLRPEVWVDLYRSNPLGSSLPPSDPTAWPRWFYMMAASVSVAGVGMIWIGRGRLTDTATAVFLRKAGHGIAAAGALLSVLAALWVFERQPVEIQQQLKASTVCTASAWIWLGAAFTVAALGILGPGPGSGKLKASVMSLGIVLQIAAMVVYRDLVRDLTLALRGYDVWNRAVVTNWSVVILFFVIFIAGLGAMAWLTWVAARAASGRESAATGSAS